MVKHSFRNSTGRFSDLELVEKAGTQGVELLNWLAMRGAVSAGGASVKVRGNYHIPISKTATGLLALEVARGPESDGWKLSGR